MKRKAIIFAWFLIFWGSAAAQYSAQTEYSYLKLINSQQNKPLIKDNLESAELTAHNLILKQPSAHHALFYEELARSHQIVENPSKALFYRVLQRSVVPCDSMVKPHKAAFLSTAYAAGLSNSQARAVWHQTRPQEVPEQLAGKLQKALKVFILIHDERIENKIFNLGQQLKQLTDSIPAWYQHWEFLSRIGVEEKCKKQAIDYNRSSHQPIYQITEGKLQQKIYHKSLIYYIKMGAVTHANQLLAQYKALELSFWRQLDALWLSSRLQWN